MTASSSQRRGAQSWQGQVGRALGLAALGISSLCAGQVSAQSVPSCLGALPGLPEGAKDAPRIWGRGGSAPNALVGALAVEVQESKEPLVVLYQDDGACFAMDALVGDVPFKTEFRYWTRNAEGKVVPNTCELPLDAENRPVASWGSMAQLADSCGINLPDDVYDGVGPISGFSLLVHKESSQQVISAEAVYYIYGLGLADAKYHVSPWTVPAAIGSRTTTSAAGLLLAKAVGIPLTHNLYGSRNADGSSGGPNDVKTNGGMVTRAVQQAELGNAEATLGFASTETVDANRDKVRSLAFQAAGQTTGYWPDSDASAYDKINLRQGRYFLWNPHHFYARLDENKQIPDPDVRRWIEYLTKGKPLPAGARDFLDVQIDVGNVPLCAMQVRRDGDVGPLSSFQPDVSCGCYYEKEAHPSNAEPEQCVACVNQDGPELPNEEKDPACPSDTPYCRYGFCEVK